MLFAFGFIMLKLKFCSYKNLSKGQIFRHYLINAFRLLPESSHLILTRLTKLVLVAPATTNAIFEFLPIKENENKDEIYHA